MARPRTVFEYVPVKEFAARSGFSVQGARDYLNSPEGLRFKRQRGPNTAILVNWTMFQEYMETEANPIVKYAVGRPGRPAGKAKEIGVN